MTRWRKALWAVRCLAADPFGLGGLHLKARAGPVRDALLADLSTTRKLPVGVSDGALYGELDISATLAAARPVRRAGLLETPGLLVLPSAERCLPDLAAKLGQAIDQGHHAIIALDEGEEGLPPALSDRLGLVLDLDGLAISDIANTTDIDEFPVSEPVLDPIEVLTRLALSLGVGSARAPLIAMRLARVVAELAGGPLSEAHCAFAAELVLAPRATEIPMQPEEQEPETPPAPEAEPAGEVGRLEDRILDAVQTALPAHLLDGLALKATGAKGAGAGTKQRGNRRGRPLPPRPGRPDGRARIDLVATLRAAAPWQRLRGAAPGRAVAIRGSDIRLKRAESRSDRLVIFAVDASGSAAAARLAEAKGAVEHLLAEAYARRDHVALIGFRGAGAETLLPPTRSLVRTKRQLAALPGGGGTPLAAGLREGVALAHQARARGMAPALVVLTDGRPNITLSGKPGRPQALEDAQAMGRLVRSEGLSGLVIDTGPGPLQHWRSWPAVWASPVCPCPAQMPERYHARSRPRCELGGVVGAMAPGGAIPLCGRAPLSLACPAIGRRAGPGLSAWRRGRHAFLAWAGPTRGGLVSLHADGPAGAWLYAARPGAVEPERND